MSSTCDLKTYGLREKLVTIYMSLIKHIRLRERDDSASSQGEKTGFSTITY